jgi:hypothetical protein
MGGRELIHSLQKTAEERSKAAAGAFDAFLKRHFEPGAARRAREGLNAVMEEIEGDPIADTAARARYHDLVVLARAGENDDFSTDAIANILVGCGRPILLVPTKALADIGICAVGTLTSGATGRVSEPADDVQRICAPGCTPRRAMSDA